MFFNKMKFLKVVMLAVVALCVCGGVAEAKNATKAKSTKATKSKGKNNSSSATSGDASQRPSEEQIKQIFDGQAPMTEDEVSKILVDFPKVKAMTNNDEAVKFLESEGWTPKRMTYVIVKTSLTRDVIRHGGGPDVINKLPKQLRPQKGELDLVKKHLAKIEEVFPSKKEAAGK